MDNETIIFETPKIYFPKLFTAVSKTVPHIELTSDAAVTTGYSFRKKRHSVKITNYHGRSHKELIIPYSIDGMPVDEICGHAFENYPCTVIYIHGNIRRLGEGVFRGSTVRKVIFEDGITSLPKNAFAYCKTLEQVELPLTLKHIGYECFFVCKSLKYIEFPKSICTIENRAFLSCGLENFAVEAPTQGINNAYAFVSYAVSPPMFVDNQVVCTYPDPSNLTVLYVNGGPYRLKADSVTFCRWSLKSNSLDLSECKKVSFYRNAICNGRKRDDKDIGYGVSHCKIILPERNEDEHHYAFSEHVTVINNFHQKDRLYTKPYEIEYDSTDDTYNITPVADYLPPWTIEEECEKIRIKGHVHIDRNAINCRNLKEITFEDFCPEDRVFSLSCSELRKVSFNYKGQMVTKYISPGELVSGIINELMILSFAPCSAPSENGSGRTVYDRQIIDSIFHEKYASTANNRSIARLKRIKDFAYQSRWIDFNSKFSPLRISNKRMAIVAVDILRSDRLDHEPPVDMYCDFLRTHRSFCYKYFSSISDQYPEYIQAFKRIMLDSGKNTVQLEADKKIQVDFLRQQNELRDRIEPVDKFDIDSVKLIAGVDLAYWNKGDDEYAVCCIVVIDNETHEVVEKQHYSGKIDVPYMPGFLAFRELPLILKTVELLEASPDIFIFDGNGYLHPRHMGIATHASFYLNKPTVGIAKTYFRVDKKTDYTEPENEAGSYTDIIIDGVVYGRALRTHTDVKPIFISIGNYISLDTACALAMRLTDKESHIPIPTRLADLETHIAREAERNQ